MGKRNYLIFALPPMIAAWLGGTCLWIAQTRLEKQHQAFLETWDLEYRVTQEKLTESDGLDQEQ
jgi:hypothetical protein